MFGLSTAHTTTRYPIDSYLLCTRQGARAQRLRRIYRYTGPLSWLLAPLFDEKRRLCHYLFDGRSLPFLLSPFFLSAFHVCICSRLAFVRHATQNRKIHLIFLAPSLWPPTTVMAAAALLRRAFAHRPASAEAAAAASTGLFGGRSSAAVRVVAPSSLASALASSSAANAVAARYMSTDGGPRHRNIGISAHIDRYVCEGRYDSHYDGVILIRCNACGII